MTAKRKDKAIIRIYDKTYILLKQLSGITGKPINKIADEAVCLYFNNDKGEFMRILTVPNIENAVKCACGCVYEIRINDVKFDKLYNPQTRKSKIVLFFTECPICGDKNEVVFFNDSEKSK